MKKLALALMFTTLVGTVLTACGGGGSEEYNEDGKMILNLKNLYFSDWAGGDAYTDVLEEKFNVKIKPASYDYNSWGEQVTSAVNANNLPDIFHFDLESFNFGNTYEFWAKGKIIKALPDDMSTWPNLQNLLNNISNVDSLKIDGKLYGIPLAYNINEPDKNYSSFTYVYHRDWAKQYNVYKENDEYTWDEFLAVIQAFQDNVPTIMSGDASALGDVEWGFPSITNFYKDAPHCYTYENGKVVNAFTTEKYIEGLNKAKSLISKGAYYEQETAHTGDVHDEYKAGRIGIYYENLSLTNYTNLRKEYKTAHPGITNAELDDAIAFMKVKGPDGKYALEGSENWFSMSMFNYDITDQKMNKILDIIDYLLSEDGTRLAIYGIEGYDYEIIDDEIELLESGWLTDKDGEYVPKNNGAKYLRYMATLGHDTLSFDPMTNRACYDIVRAWEEDMKTAKSNNDLRVFVEPGEIKWLSTNLKNSNTSAMISEGNENAMKYCYNVKGYETKENYIASFSSKWMNTIAEINSVLGK